MNLRQLKQRFVLHLDPVLLSGLGALLLVSLLTLYSASDGNSARVLGQLCNIAVAFIVLWIIANMPLHWLKIGRASCRERV